MLLNQKNAMSSPLGGKMGSYGTSPGSTPTGGAFTQSTASSPNQDIPGRVSERRYVHWKAISFRLREIAFAIQNPPLADGLAL